MTLLDVMEPSAGGHESVLYGRRHREQLVHWREETMCEMLGPKRLIRAPCTPRAAAVINPLPSGPARNPVKMTTSRFFGPRGTDQEIQKIVRKPNVAVNGTGTDLG